MDVALRVGFLGLITAMVVSQITGGLPFSPGAPGIVGSLSWLSLFAIAVPAFFGLYTALAGQSVFGSGDAD